MVELSDSEKWDDEEEVLYHISSTSLQRANACVFGATTTPKKNKKIKIKIKIKKNAVRQHITVHCAVSLPY